MINTHSANVAWAKAVFSKSPYYDLSEVQLRKEVRDEDLTVELRLTDTTVKLYADNGDYFVDGGPRGKIYCTQSFGCALGTMFQELAHTVPA